MNITITHCRYAPRWDTLERLLQETTNQPNGTLIRIARKDGGANYSSPGQYEARFRPENQLTVLLVNLDVLGY